jgi:hypothetical protein
MRCSWPVLLVAIMAGTAIGAARAGDMEGGCAQAKESSIQCYREKTHARMSYMEARLLEPPRVTEPASEPESPVDFALRQWSKCVAQAADAMADRSEPARTVVDAAFRRCSKYETAFRHLQPYKQEIIDKFKSETMVPGLLDFVMSVRTREKLER